MREFTVQVLQMRESSFRIGLNMGEYIRNKPIVKLLEAITRTEIDYQNMKCIYSSFAPHLLDELEGLSQGLEISSSKAAALFSGYDVPKMESMGCSSIITKDYYVRNYDFSPDFYDGIFSLIQSNTSFASAGYNLQLLGRHDGVNQEGLVAGLHFVSNNGYTTGISPWVAIRVILDQCSSVDDAINMLKEMPHAACYNFSLGDKKGSIAVVEASPEKVHVRRGEVLSCVNHFQDDRLKDKNRVSIGGSVQRNRHLQDLFKSKLTHDEMFDHFRRGDSPIFFTNYEELFGTLHTFSYSYNKSRILTTIAHSNQVLDINFKDWVQGEDIDRDFIQGGIVEK
ncbi:peptidase C45 [Ornithinibacillus sp. L9]|uniref:Peptidase C45 n=1 Tax=Ornithinibacillus caprae TaxID=2678566 RepID=A0A6N8FLK2_9BACI|nr:C45 family peptidase [Ornithinibacillus caprae]MUK88857.1 peptidase C45 [Ornithinibacillus caprae]